MHHRKIGNGAATERKHDVSLPVHNHCHSCNCGGHNNGSGGHGRPRAAAAAAAAFVTHHHQRFSQIVTVRRYGTSVAVVVACFLVLLWWFTCGGGLGGWGARRFRLSTTTTTTTTTEKEQARAAATDQTTAYYDVIVVGAGPAGLTASLFAARAGLSVLVFGSEAGQLSEAAALDNFPSFYHHRDRAEETASVEQGGGGGASWLTATKQQAAATGNVHFALAGLRVSKLMVDRSHQTPPEYSTSLLEFSTSLLFALELSPATAATTPAVVVHSRAVIVATGANNRRLQLEHEDALWGKSVHSCAICDGSAYSNRRSSRSSGTHPTVVVVVGGGDAAIDAALLLARHVTKVILIHRRNDFRASNQRNLQSLLHLRDDSNNHNNSKNNPHQSPIIVVKRPYVVERYEVRPITTTITKFNQKQPQQLTAVHVRNSVTDATERIACDGVFLMIGSVPNTEFLKGTLKLDVDGLVVLRQDGTTATSVEGVFAAGEISDNRYKQAITAAAAGAQSAIDAERWLRQTNNHNRSSVTAIVFSPHALPDTIPLQTIDVTTTTVQQGPEESLMERAKPESPVQTAIAATTKEDCDLSHEDCIQALVLKHAVVVFSKPWCPYCKKALETLAVEGVQEPYLHVISLVDPRSSSAVQNALAMLTGRRTVPNVFVGGISIGGGDETVTLHRQGKLHSMLLSARAFPLPNSEKTTAATGHASCDLTLADCITTVVENHAVVVFSKPWCPYCVKVIEMFMLEGVSVEPHLHVIDLAALGDRGGLIQDTLLQMTGRRTVPNVFIGGKSIGGYDETTQLLEAGKLRSLLDQEGQGV